MNKTELKQIFTPKQYQVELFKVEEFIRKKCRSCDHYFWSVLPDRETCGDTPCEGGYTFIGRKGPNWNFHQAIAQLTDFFEKNNHTAIDSYPTVARWRDDLEFTIASIADFQPWVTNGTIPPPANPLVVAQPCIRFGGEFSDLDNVGRTGRHLTSFVMFGQHSFNSKKLTNGYWMDRCIELNFDFLTSRLGLQVEDITYVEDIWMGGGNFGPNLESFAFGTEIVNSVFMQYENTPSGYKEMDLKVIDVGWGLERVSWFSQGTPTIYEATFGPVLDFLVKSTGVKIKNDLLINYAKLAGLVDVNEVKDLKSARSGIANQLGYSLEELNSELADIEALYALADHARTLAFTLADGSIPSNVGGGYNLRTVIRRMFTINEIRGFNVDITDLIERSALYLSQSYPRIKEVISFAASIIDIERDRHNNTISKGEKYVNQLIASKKKITDDILVELYTSRGIPPETVKNISDGKGIEITIPLDFYQQVEESIPKNQIQKADEPQIDLGKIKDLETTKLYYDENYLKESKATITAILDTGHVVFDKTIFYPTGGGQAEDHGWIIFGKQEISVLDVKKFGTAIIHKLSKIPDKMKIGSKVMMKLDWERRLALMRHHTAVHIVGGAAREILGSHVWQAGADKTPDRGRLDITHWESISRETLDEIEYVANSIVMENVKIHKHELLRTEAEKRFGFTIYQGGVVPGETLRIIEIPGIDTEACGGTHANNTGDIGYIRIIGSERIQDGIVRITITAGKRAVEHVQHDYSLLFEASDTFSINPEKLPQTAERFFNEWKDQAKTISKLSKELAIAKIPELINQKKEISTKLGNTISLIYTIQNGPQADLLNLATQISEQTETYGNVIVVILGNDGEKAMCVVGRSKNSNWDISKLVRELSKLLGGGGGGRGDVVAGGGSKVHEINHVYQLLENKVADLL